MPVAIVVAAFLASSRGSGVHARDPHKSAALAEALTARGMTCTSEDVTWLSETHGLAGSLFNEAHAVVRAHTADEPSDLYLVVARLSPEGHVLTVGSTWDVTRTTGVDEGRPLVRGTRLAYVTSTDGLATGIHTLDLAGEPPTPDFTRLQRWQTEITNVQQTGQARGVVHDAYALDPAANKVDLAWRDDGKLGAVADARAITIDVEKAAPIEGGGWVRAVPFERARPGNLVTWAVDRVRGIPWFGEERMQYVKAIAFTALDWVLRTRERFFGDSGASDLAEDLGSINSGQSAASYTDPEIGWPPAPMKPMISPPLPGEGKWIALDHDPFITEAPGAPSAFVTSFVRADRARPQTRVYITMWDPRQIALHMEAGTVEPVSASGEAGPGVIPRTPEVMRRVVAGFNGGFQALHGEYGMQADGVLYLPPKPYAATVLEMRDGSNAFGSWPGNSEVPDEILSYRQNLTALVEAGQWNPWGRTWWGGTPNGWKDNVHTTRSGLCLTKENFIGYFYGVDISADVLAEGMTIARCAYGMHLDMNPGLVGFEFYNVQPTSTFQPLGRKLQEDWEVEGTVKELPEFKFRARRMIKAMRHMNFPQYIQRDGRDFFYLTERAVLPGAELASGVTPKLPGEGAWTVKGLPQHGFPYAVATSWIRPDASRPEVKVRALRVDARAVVPAGAQGTSEATPTIVSFNAPRAADETNANRLALSAWLADGVFTIAASAPSQGAASLADGVALASANASHARAAVGVQDEDGMLDWIELAPDVPASAANAKMLDAILASAGCTSRMLVVGSPRALLGGTTGLDGEPAAVSGETTAARLVRGSAPGAHPYFTSTPIVPPSVWQPLQMQRVRYFHKPKKKPPPDAGAPTPAPTSSAPTP